MRMKAAKSGGNGPAMKAMKAAEPCGSISKAKKAMKTRGNIKAMKAMKATKGLGKEKRRPGNSLAVGEAVGQVGNLQCKTKASQRGFQQCICRASHLRTRIC